MNNFIKICHILCGIILLSLSQASYSDSCRARTPNFEVVCDDLGDIVKKRADLIRKKVTDEGRTHLLNEMVKYPEQLGKDLNRVDIKIPGQEIDRESPEFLEKNEKEKFLFVADKLAAYAKSMDISNVDNLRIEPFWIIEILYAAAAQNFLAEQWGVAKKNEPILDQEIWAPVSKGSALISSIEIKKPLIKIFGDNLVIVTFTSRKPLNLVSGEEGEKLLVLQSIATFNLNKGSVTFEKNYQLDGKIKRW